MRVSRDLMGLGDEDIEGPGFYRKEGLVEDERKVIQWRRTTEGTNGD